MPLAGDFLSSCTVSLRFAIKGSSLILVDSEEVLSQTTQHDHDHNIYIMRRELSVCRIVAPWSTLAWRRMHLRETLIQAVDTCLSSKVVSQNCETISPMAVDAVLGIIDTATATNVDLRDIKVNNETKYTIVGILSYFVAVDVAGYPR